MEVRETGRGQVSQDLATQGRNVGFSSKKNEEPLQSVDGKA